jgi:hypothetical protein
MQFRKIGMTESLLRYDKTLEYVHKLTFLFVNIYLGCSTQHLKNYKFSQ